MPKYSYSCKDCGPFDLHRDSSLRDSPKACPKCGKLSERDLVHEFRTGSQKDRLLVENERWSWAMGCHVSQIPEMQKRYPGSEYHPKTGQLKIKNRNAKLQAMKQRGFEEF